MPNPNAVVSALIRFEAAPERLTAEALRSAGGVSIELEGGRRARLDAENPRSAGFAQILDGLSKQRLPVYLELDPETSAVTRLLIPHLTRVAGIGEGKDGTLDVQLELSSARHRLPRKQEYFAELEKQLREAMDSGKPVIVTEDDEHNIIDVRLFIPSPDGPEVPLPPFPPFPPKLPELKSIPANWFKDFSLKLWYWCGWPWWWIFKCKCVSQAKAQQVFNTLSATSCDPLTVPPPCIPFLYPDDGCWGRAHEMCRLMINMGLKPKKVWIQGSLHVSTANNPTCNVYWGWHVAPTLCVRTSFFSSTTMVIDPSLFTTPVSKATWKSVQGDPGATLTDSAAEIFYLWWNTTDPTYVQTNQVLATYRLQLQNRALTYGPPPYACP